MALVVEDGTGLAAANSYVSIAEADTYAADKNETAWSGYSSAIKTAALINASLYLDASFSFIGNKTSAGQGLAWPRTGVVDYVETVTYASNAIPLVLKRAVIELAIKNAAGGDLLEDLAHGGRITSEQVGPLKVTYSEQAPAGTIFGITMLLKGLIVSRDETYAPNVKAPTFDADQYFGSNQFQNFGSGRSPGGS